MPKDQLTKEQMMRLVDLGIETKGAAWREYDNGEWYDAFSVLDLLTRLPRSIKPHTVLQVEPCTDGWYWVVGYSIVGGARPWRTAHLSAELIDALFALYCWCIEHDYVDSKQYTLKQQLSRLNSNN